MAPSFRPRLQIRSPLRAPAVAVFEPVGLRHVISSIFGTKYLVMQVVAIAVIAVLYVFRTPRDKFGLLVVAIVSFILLTTAANERMRRLRIYAKWLYD